MATEVTLERARSGDDRAFGELTDPYRGELQLHCYRILGSVQDAEDVLQETLLAAWRGLRQYEGRASLRTWLYRIATNRCLNALRASGRRPRTEPSGPTFLTVEPTRLPGPGRERAALPRSARERDIATRFATAFAGNDIDGVVALLTDDAWFTMPPVTLEYQGHEAIAGFLRDINTWRGPRRYRLIPTRANGQPAFGCYLQDAQAPVFRAHGLIVLTLQGDRISAITRFVDNSNMARFGLPRMLAD